MAERARLARLVKVQIEALQDCPGDNVRGMLVLVNQALWDASQLADDVLGEEEEIGRTETNKEKTV